MMSKSKDPKANTLKGLLIAGVVALALGGAALLLLWNPFSSSEAIGQRAPDFTLSDSEGRPLHLSALRGKPVVLYFSAAWCVPCRAETRQLAKLYERYRGRVQILWISFDPFNDSVEDLREHRRLYGHRDFLYALDSRVNPVAQLYRIQARGTMLLLDAQGQILFRGIRAVRDPEFMRQLTKATAGS
jgi:peroxiredoxin